MKPVKTDKVIKIVLGIGYEETRKNGSSHRIFKNRLTGITLSIPNNREIAPGTLRNLAKLESSLSSL